MSRHKTGYLVENSLNFKFVAFLFLNVPKCFSMLILYNVINLFYTVVEFNKLFIHILTKTGWYKNNYSPFRNTVMTLPQLFVL